MQKFLESIGVASKDANNGTLSLSALRLIEKALDDIDMIYDMHTHLGGSEESVTGCCTHPNLNSYFHPFSFGQQIVFKSSVGITANAGGDEEYVDKLVFRTRNLTNICVNKNGRLPQYRHLLLAMTHWHDPDGTQRPDLTTMYIPNDYMMQVVSNHPDLFDPCVSIHPAQKDALEELEKYANKGVRVIKWLPNSMGINPSDLSYIPFYNKVKELNMIILCHLGEEHAMSAGGVDQKLGNPLHLRLPLDCGVKVIGAHCASEGNNVDFDDKNLSSISNFKLFLRLMDTPKYKDLLFGDISSMLLYTRIGEPLTTILDRTDLHENLVFGSDYPVPCVGLISRTDKLQSYGYITKEERELLNEIFTCNPLLFDFVGKRCVKSPNTGNMFSKSIFGVNKKLFSI